MSPAGSPRALRPSAAAGSAEAGQESGSSGASALLARGFTLYQGRGMTIGTPDWPTGTRQVTTGETMMQAIIQEAAARHEAKPRFAILELAGVNPLVHPGGRP